MLVEIKQEITAKAILQKAIFGLFLLFGLIVPAFGQTAENMPTATTQITNKKKPSPGFNANFDRV